MFLSVEFLLVCLRKLYLYVKCCCNSLILKRLGGVCKLRKLTVCLERPLCWRIDLNEFLINQGLVNLQLYYNEESIRDNLRLKELNQHYQTKT